MLNTPESDAERAEARSAEIRDVLDNFGFAGVESYTGRIMIVRARTFRHGVAVTTGAGDSEYNIRFDPGLRIVNVDPTNNVALVTDVVRVPGLRRRHPGILRTYTVSNFFSNQPQAAAPSEQPFRRGDTFGISVNEQGYVKVFYPYDPGVGYRRAATRLVMSGELSEVEAYEFSVPEQVAWAIDVSRQTEPEVE